MRDLNLEGRWTLRRLSDRSERQMSIPGDIISGLFAAGEIPDPYYDRNELALQWIGEEDWEIFREFEVDSSLLACEHIFLNIAVIDTLADIKVNDECVGQSENSFRPFSAEIKPLLRAGRNTVSVAIHSAPKAAQQAAAALPYPIPASVYPVSSPNRNLIRKEQCMSGWDWGPCLMTGGIYDSISLCGFDGPRLASVSFSCRQKSNTAKAADRTADFDALVTLELECAERSGAEVIIEIRDGAKTVARVSRALSLEAGASIQRFSIRVDSPRLWWPNGEGGQALYTLAVRVAELGGNSSGQPFEGMEDSRHIGFRDLRVIADEDKIGRTMKFSVNGRDIFAKGANWIPADALPTRRSRSRIRALLESAVEAHFNCLRVWGGGRYESGIFYDLCDELGILVWQDCMFSCALYPSNPDFLANVEAEMRAQVRRLASHPALALWCGNNEALGAITWYDESKNSPARYIADYDRLTEGTLGRVIRQLDPERMFWPSSPSAGPGDYSDNWHLDGRGDMHFWSVWHEGKPFSEYLSIRPRFCSEFGFQSFPSYAAVAGFAPEGMRNVSSPSMEDHQRNPDGNSIIMRTMLRYFRMPRGFRETLYLSQVQQALAIKTAVEYWRSLMPVCMGTLYWQLNDVWPVTSWSSIEYNYNWKLLHYEAKRFYDPVLLALIIKDGDISAWLVNDTGFPYKTSLDIELVSFDGRRQNLAIKPLSDSVPARSSVCIWRAQIADLPLPPENAFVEATLSAASSAAPSPALTRRATAFLTEPKRCSLASSGLSMQLEDGFSGPLLTISANEAPAFFVSPSIEDPELAARGRFEDSGFYLAKGEKRCLRFIPAPALSAPGSMDAGCQGPAASVNAAALAKALKVYDLRSSYED